MTKIVNVRFHDAGKSYKFSCEGMRLNIGDAVMVETSLGLDLAHVTDEPVELDDSNLGGDISPVLRLATDKEIERYRTKKEKEQEAYEKCQQLIDKHKLNMNLVDAVFAFDGKKIVFFFTSDNRVDFRELVKDLAAAFKARIELRQIGSRDQARLVGGIGVCGRELCCCTFLSHFAPVSLKMAREQGLSLNPTKLNGACGRLMCCLQFEKEAYEDAHRRLPKNGRRIRTPEGTGTVSDVDLLGERVTVKFETEDGAEVVTYDWAQLEPLNPHDQQKPEDKAAPRGHDCKNCRARKEKKCKGNKGAGKPEEQEVFEDVDDEYAEDEEFVEEADLGLEGEENE